MLYGDAVAHINIARRVFDSRTPGLLQLGTVWLPLPHLLMIPFLISDDAVLALPNNILTGNVKAIDKFTGLDNSAYTKMAKSAMP